MRSLIVSLLAACTLTAPATAQTYAELIAQGDSLIEKRYQELLQGFESVGAAQSGSPTTALVVSRVFFRLVRFSVR